MIHSLWLSFIVAGDYEYLGFGIFLYCLSQSSGASHQQILTCGPHEFTVTHIAPLGRRMWAMSFKIKTKKLMFLSTPGVSFCHVHSVCDCGSDIEKSLTARVTYINSPLYTSTHNCNKMPQDVYAALKKPIWILDPGLVTRMEKQGGCPQPEVQVYNSSIQWK